MAKIVRYNGNLPAFASAAVGTERTLFGEVTQANDLTSQITADFLRGWGIVSPSDQPALEDFNAVMYTHGQLLAYLHQMGVAEYNAAQQYHTGSVTQQGGSLYLSLADNNTGNTPSSSPASWSPVIASGSLINVRRFTAGTTYTPTLGTKSVVVDIVGGGGGGGGVAATVAGQNSIGGGGGGGGRTIGRLTSGFSGVTITVGAAGSGGAIGSGGGTGGVTSFGSLLVANGGNGGSTTTAVSPFAAIGGTGGTTPTPGNVFNGNGQPGSPGTSLSGSSFTSGTGAPSSLGGGGGAGQGTSTASGLSATAVGAGGGGALNGATSAGQVGGPGGPGYVIIYEYA